jgi:translocator protein
VPLLPLAAFFGFTSLVCAFFLLRHAFRRSVGTGVMVLLVPAYVFFYAFSQFEHPRKNLIVSAFVACTLLAAVFFGVGARSLEAAFLPPLPRF